jgi:hypothetical protein
MIVKIKEGRHLSNQFTYPRFNWFGNGKVGAIVQFGDKAKYETKDPSNQDNWNKLFGCSWGFNPLLKQFQMHENSSRWVWRYKPSHNIFQIAPYIYADGIRLYPENMGFPIINLKPNTSIYLNIVPDLKTPIVRFNYSFDFKQYVHGIDVITQTELCAISQPIPSINGFVAPSYFGGSEAAPNDIEYFFERE